MEDFGSSGEATRVFVGENSEVRGIEIFGLGFGGRGGVSGGGGGWRIWRLGI